MMRMVLVRLSKVLTRDLIVARKFANTHKH